MKMVIPIFLVCFCLFLIGGVFAKLDLYKTYKFGNHQKAVVLDVNQACTNSKKARSSGILFNVKETRTGDVYPVVSVVGNCCDKIFDGKTIIVLMPKSQGESAIYGDISIESEFYLLLILAILSILYTLYELFKVIL